MNNLIIKLITLVTFLSIWFVDSHSIDKRSLSTEGVIIGPDTPVYYLTYPRDNYLRVLRDVNKFEASPSYNYYRNPENKSNGTFFLKVLVVLDWNNELEHKAQQDILNEILTKWNKVDKYFEQLDNPKIKLAIAGVVIPTNSNIWEPAIPIVYSIFDINADTFDLRGGFMETYCYLIPSFTNNVTNWFNDNAGQFENLKYDFFIFMSHRDLTSSKNSEDCKYHCHNTNQFACGTENGADHRSLGGIAVNYYHFTKKAAYTIASILGVMTDEEYGCESGHIMDSSQVRDDLTWSKCSKRVFRSMVNNTRYTCLHQIPHDQDENDYS